MLPSLLLSFKIPPEICEPFKVFSSLVRTKSFSQICRSQKFYFFVCLFVLARFVCFPLLSSIIRSSLLFFFFFVPFSSPSDKETSYVHTSLSAISSAAPSTSTSHSPPTRLTALVKWRPLNVNRHICCRDFANKIPEKPSLPLPHQQHIRQLLSLHSPHLLLYNRLDNFIYVILQFTLPDPIITNVPDVIRTVHTYVRTFIYMHTYIHSALYKWIKLRYINKSVA